MNIYDVASTVVGNEEQNIDISSVTKLLNIFDDHFVSYI